MIKFNKERALSVVDWALGDPTQEMSWARSFALAGGTFVVLMAVAAGFWLISTTLCIVYMIAVLLVVIAANVVSPIMERKERRDG